MLQNLSPNVLGINTVPAQRQWKPLEVTEIATGERIIIKDYRFNPALHKDAKMKGSSAPIVIKSDPVQLPKKEAVEGATDRFAELKAIGWAKLNKEERVEYKALKQA